MPLIETRPLRAAIYRVTAYEPENGGVEEIVTAVSAEHAAKVVLAAHWEVHEWGPGDCHLFCYASLKDLHRLVPGFTVQVKYLGRGPEKVIDA